MISAYTLHDAHTVHRLLYSLGDMTIPADLVIIDEVSMPDIYLFKWLLSHIDEERTKILMIGDSSQISSVGAGSILHSLLNSPIIPKTTLTKVFRYGEGGIMTVATETREGRPYLSSLPIQKFGTNNDYMFIQTDSSKRALKTIVDVYTKLLGKYAPEDIAILSPYNVGNCGSTAINQVIQPIANPLSIGSDAFIESFDTKYYVGDMIMQTKNNYNSIEYKGDNNNLGAIESAYSFAFIETFISNGDVGKVVTITNDLVLIDFDGVKVIYSKDDLVSCKHAYALSYHKSQGSGFKVVILVTMPEHSRSMTSNLLYVGLTRAKERVVHIGDYQTINGCIPIKDELSRLTYLKDLLDDIAEERKVAV